jgi:ABC-type uncharacterized transport system substrate-binding protein
MYTILAVAVGPEMDVLVDPDFVKKGGLAGIRPYIGGLIDGLKTSRRELGADFVIQYRQTAIGKLQKAVADALAQKQISLIFPMSTSALKAAMGQSKPIVFPSISDPAADGVGPGSNATGVSAQRTQSVKEALTHFASTVPSLKRVVALHKPRYEPATRAVSGFKADGFMKPQVSLDSVTVSSRQEIVDAIAAIPARDMTKPPDVGVLALPDDLCFGEAPTIVAEAHKRGIPTWFTAADYADLHNALGAFGIGQHTCGALAADFVEKILWGGQSPDKLPIKLADAFEWKVSRKAAAALKISVTPGGQLKLVN